MKYTEAHASLCPSELKDARKAAAEAVKAAEATLSEIREIREALEIESFRRLHAKKIDDIVAKIRSSPDLLKSLHWLRINKAARLIGVPSVYSRHDPHVAAWSAIIGKPHLNGWRHTTTERRMVEIVLALIPTEPTP
jgi:hypothetical protein